MRGLYILLLAQISVQLQCDKTNIQATVGSTVTIICTYRASQYRFSKKYWCAGDSRSSCEVRMDTDGFSDAAYRTRAQIIDRVSKGVIVSIRDLKLEDTGLYWVAIDKIYADLMTRIKVTVTKEAVDKPNVWPLSSLEGTCWGEPVVFRCGSMRGTNAQYTWYRVGHPNNIVLHHSSDLCLQCSNIIEDGQLFCSAYNDVSSQRSDFVTLQLLQPGDKNCVYLISSKAFSSYECIRSTTPLSTSIRTMESLSTSIHPQKLGSTVTVFQLTWSQNKTMSGSALPLWYECLRWVLFSTMIIVFSIVHSCSKPYRFSAQDKHPKDV